MRFLNRTLAILAILVLVLGSAVTVFADETQPTAATEEDRSNVTYSGNAGTFIFEPGTDYSVTDLFPNFKDVLPGDSITQRIAIKNKANRRVDVRIYMRSLGAHEDSVEFLSQLGLDVTLATDTDLFEAPADQTAQLTEWVLLGKIKSGGEVELDVTLNVPVTMGNEFTNQVGYLDWQFRVEELPAGSGPQTGDDMNLGLYIGVAAVAAVAIVVVLILLLWKKKDQEDKKRSK